MPAKANLTGERKGNLLIVEHVSNQGWIAVCDCGNKVYRISTKNWRGESRLKDHCGCKTKRPNVGEYYRGVFIKKEIKDPMKRNGNVKYEIICSCGKIFIRHQSNIMKTERDPKCKDCSDLLPHASVKTIVNSIYKSYKNNASNRNYSFNLTIEEFQHIIERPCFYCGEIASNLYGMNKNKKVYKIDYYYNGVDRLNNDLGYEQDNVVPCCADCNYMKGRMSDKDFLNKIFQIVNYRSLND